VAGTLTGLPAPTNAQEEAVRLLDRLPFDRVTLGADDGGQQIDVALLDLPKRRVPKVFPEGGELEVIRMSEPSTVYRIRWTSIAKLELFEQLLLNEAKRLTARGSFAEAYDYLAYLDLHYARLDGLPAAIEKYLVRDAAATYTAKRYDESLMVLLALYDRNPNRPGLERSVGVVGNRLITDHLSARDFVAARSVLDLLRQGFPNLEIASVPTWEQRFLSDAAEQLAMARQAIDQGEYQQARQAVRRAQGILPQVSGADALMGEINLRCPQIVVGVSQHGGVAGATSVNDWPTARVRRLISPQFVELVGFGAEGGIYECRAGELASDDSGLGMEIRLHRKSLAEGITPEKITLELLRMSNPASPSYQVGLASVLQNIGIDRGQGVNIRWKVSHVRPEALLRIPLLQVVGTGESALAYRSRADSEEPALVRFTPTVEGAQRLPTINRLQGEKRQQTRESAGPSTIIEQAMTSEEEAIAAILHGKVDALDRIAPWQVESLRKANDVIVDFYRLPTVHVLIPNYSNPLLGRREFRRALCYGIDRQQILDDIILGGRKTPGFRVLSGPLPSGLSQSDSIGYAYNHAIQPLPYEPRLAAILSGAARAAVSKAAEKTPKETTQGEARTGPAETPAPQESRPAAATPLVLAHPPDTLARTVCQTMRLQLEAIGIPIKLRELSPQETTPPANYDLLYTDLAMWEPLVDVRRLFGPAGRAGSCSGAMSLALQNVESAQNWKQARTRLRQVHQIATSDLPVIPLWQTINAFAYRRTLSGVGSSPISLYQNITEWKIRLPGAGGAE